jgi:hypothetical protein
MGLRGGGGAIAILFFRRLIFFLGLEFWARILLSVSPIFRKRFPPLSCAKSQPDKKTIVTTEE